MRSSIGYKSESIKHQIHYLINFHTKLNNNIIFIWIPSHNGIQDVEKPNTEAKNYLQVLTKLKICSQTVTSNDFTKEVCKKPKKEVHRETKEKRNSD